MSATGPGGPPVHFRRRGKEWVERLLAVGLLVLTSPLLGACALAIKIEALLDPNARGPVLFREQRIARGRIIDLLKFRTLDARALMRLGDGPTHIAVLEKQGHLTRVGRAIRRWYLDELPQLLNIVRGDFSLIGTRPYPIELYEQELSRGVTRKRDMPAGLIGPVQAHKGAPDVGDGIALDLEYWEAYRTLPAWKLLLLDGGIVLRSIKVQLQHKGL